MYIDDDGVCRGIAANDGTDSPIYTTALWFVILAFCPYFVWGYCIVVQLCDSECPVGLCDSVHHFVPRSAVKRFRSRHRIQLNRLQVLCSLSLDSLCSCIGIYGMCFVDELMMVQSPPRRQHHILSLWMDQLCLWTIHPSGQ